jgi:hypothetical protein
MISGASLKQTGTIAKTYSKVYEVNLTNLLELTKALTPYRSSASGLSLLLTTFEGGR